jgi:hypothetical protein
MTIRNPIEWATDQLKLAGLAVGSASRAGVGVEEGLEAPLPGIRPIRVADLLDVLSRGFDDFAAYRTDVIFLCIVYPVIGLVLGRLAFGCCRCCSRLPRASLWSGRLRRSASTR